jgi:hypothetical protein
VPVLRQTPSEGASTLMPQRPRQAVQHTSSRRQWRQSLPDRNALSCRIQRAPRQAGSGHRWPGRSLASSTGQLHPAVTSRQSRRTESAADVVDSVTLSDGRRLGRTLAEPPFCHWSLPTDVAAHHTEGGVMSPPKTVDARWQLAGCPVTCKSARCQLARPARWFCHRSA